MSRSRHERLVAFGVSPEFHDAFGNHYALDDEAAEQVLAAMDVEPDLDGPPRSDAVVVTRPDAADPAPDGELELEDGGRMSVAGVLPTGLPLGYHTLHRTDGGTTRIIVSPGSCVPHPERIWGFAAQLYSLGSAGSWGVGDLADLAMLGRWAGAEGAEVLLINPLDAVVAEVPREDSPYFPSSRRFRDPLYLRIEDVPGAEAIAEHLPALRAAATGGADRIERRRIVTAKLEALELLWARRDADADDAAGFAAFRAEQGDALQRFATFEALVEHHGSGWRRWPAAFHDPDGPAVARFAAEHPDRIAFHVWIQWLLDVQLQAAGAAVPLMRDLPIGVDPDGADAWEWQDTFATGVTVGAPPDELGPAGQDWRVPAWIPWKLRQVGYQPWVETLRAAFRHAAALRIDHVLGLFRLFWVPPGGPRSGAYVAQDARELLDILALESHRAGAYVIGEDLGTVMEGVRDELVTRGMLRYRVVWFEEERPHEWDRRGLGSITTHDLPSVGGLWTRSDLEVLRSLGHEVDEARIERMRDDLADRAQVPTDAGVHEACVSAAHLLSGAGCDVVVMQLEDAVGATHRINVPGTDAQERPDNWSVPFPVRLEELPAHPTARAVAAALREHR
ncbi:MAG: 4-alpha-glucanotransferase [Nitriliruptoraceae bacterium]|nr:4-alpha-glucanotransferase [Nitriliruptoraceae bacterium]